MRCSKLNKAFAIDGTPIEMFKNGLSSHFILKLFNIFYPFIFLNPFTTGCNSYRVVEYMNMMSTLLFV